MSRDFLTRFLTRDVLTGVRDHLLIVIVGIAVLLPGLGDAHLWDVDEALWAGTAAEMGRRQDWVVPHFNGELSIQKPPFMYWTMLIGSRMFADAEFAARIGSAVFGLAAALVTFSLGRLLFERRVGLVAGIILVTSLMFDIVSRGATPDSELVFFCTLALLFFARGIAAGGWPSAAAITTLPLTAAVGMYAAMGLAVLTKGPIGVVLPTAALGLFLLVHNATRSAAGVSAPASPWGRLAAWPGRAVAAAWTLRPITGILTVAAVAGPWYVLVQRGSGGAFGAGFIGVHNIERFFRPFEHHSGSVLYYLPAFLLGFFPWSMFAIPTALDSLRRLRGGAAAAAGPLLLGTWILTWVAFFTLAQTKLPNYILPVFPAVAVLTAACLVRWAFAADDALRPWMRAGTGLLALCGALGFATSLLVPTIERDGTTLLESFRLAPEVNQALAATRWIGIAMMAGGVVSFLLATLNRRREALLAFSGAAVAVSWAVFLVAAGAADRHQPSPKLVAAIRAHADGGDWMIGQHRYSAPSLVYYAERPVAECPDRASIAQFLEGGPNRFIVVATPTLAERDQLLPSDARIVYEQPGFPKAGRIVVIGRDDAVRQRTADGRTNLIRP